MFILIFTFSDSIFLDSMIHISFPGKLSVPAETVQHGVEGLMFILTESAKLMVRNTFIMSLKINIYSMYNKNC